MLTELVDHPARGRVFEHRLMPGIADAVAGGRVRIDAIARWLQDAAYLDLIDAGFAERGVWIVRRCRIAVAGFPRFGEEVAVRTFCSAIGRFAAERRTSIQGDGAAVEAVATWVWLDGETMRPARFPAEFISVYEESAGGRRANVRVRHPEPSDEAAASPWTFRADDVDVAGHVNNSHHWAALEQEWAAAPPDSFDGEIEYHDPARPGPARVLADGAMRWIADEGGAVSASIELG